MYQLFSKLNPQQQEAVEYKQGPLLVIAGAGSGKTSVITTKIAYLIGQCGFKANTVVAITFTNKAAKEMLERSSKFLQGIDTKGLIITTFHSLGLKILKSEAEHLGYKPNFSILDSHDSYKIISDIAQTTDKTLVKKIQGKISGFKNHFRHPEEVLSAGVEDVGVEIGNIYRQYQDTLKTYNTVDFDDLIKLPAELLSTNPTVLYKWQQKINHLLVDEYQDTNQCQYRLIKLLVERSGMLTVVGDDDQSIYAWRGANIDNLKYLQQDFPQLKIIKLEQNYRSTSTILNAANAVIRYNQNLFNKKLWSHLGVGNPIQVVRYKNDEDEAESIARKIMLHQLQRQSSFSDYAILYRSNYQSRILEQTLRNHQLPYQISGGQSFFDKAEIKDIIAYLRLIVNLDDDIAFIRAVTTPKRGIGQITLDKLAQYGRRRNVSLFSALFEEGFAVECKSAQLEELLNFGKLINNIQYQMRNNFNADCLIDLLKTINYESYLYEHESIKIAEKKFANVLNLISWLSHKAEHKTLSELLHTITLVNILDNSDNSSTVDAIKLSTLHAAKGLEFPYVYLISCEEGILPHQESMNKNMIEEERRLIYVGITRAQKELTISYCNERRSEGELRLAIRSRFIEEIGADNIEDSTLRQHQKISDNTELKLRLDGLRKLLNS